MFQSIPASQIVSINPAVLSSGGSPLSMNAVFLSKNTNLITGEAKEFVTANSVGEYFGLTSPEYEAAVVYFSGFDNSTIKPGSVYFCAYNEAEEAAFLLGASVKALSLESLKSVSGTLTVNVDGVAKTVSDLSLSEVTSFSDAASKIESALSGIKLVFDSQLQAFRIESKTAGAGSSIAHATGTTADALGLSKKAGATISKGSPADTPVSLLHARGGVSQS